MTTSPKDSLQNSTGNTAPETSPPPATDRREDLSQALNDWLKRASASEDRMASDEDYRQEMAKRVS